jgi:hypothetical protein
MDAWCVRWPHLRSLAHQKSDDPGVGSALIIGEAKTPREAVDDSVGSDFMRDRYPPLTIRPLEEQHWAEHPGCRRMFRKIWRNEKLFGGYTHD